MGLSNHACRLTWEARNVNEKAFEREGPDDVRGLARRLVEFPLAGCEGEHDALETMVKWIEQDSSSQPEKYLEDCDTKICGE